MFSFKNLIKKIFRQGIKPVCNRVCDVMKFVPPGHFYSPIPSDQDFQNVYQTDNLEISSNSEFGINFNIEKQLQLLETIAIYHDQILPFPINKKEDYRFYYNNYYYSYPDATVFFCLLNHLKPQKIIDVGGGNSTTLMLDLNDHCFRDQPMDITIIEPYPQRIENLFQNERKLTKIYQKVQDVDLKIFENLKAGDLLFLDTSHVSKLGSEVNYLAFNILPRLQSGVIIHIHEMFYPFEYPPEFYEVGKVWNEIYLWRAFLTHNNDYEIMFHNSFLAKKFPQELKKALPNYFNRGRKDVNVQCEGSSLWLRKI